MNKYWTQFATVFQFISNTSKQIYNIKLTEEQHFTAQVIFQVKHFNVLLNSNFNFFWLKFFRHLKNRKLYSINNLSMVFLLPLLSSAPCQTSADCGCVLLQVKVEVLPVASTESNKVKAEVSRCSGCAVRCMLRASVCVN